jgi:hypothetical protein
MTARSLFLAATIALAAVASPAPAQISGNSLTGLLDNASDAALDRLSRPGAFSADDAIRISLPGTASKFGDALKFTDRIGVTNDLSGQLNRAAEAAGAEAKPIFRAAIDRITMRDAIGIGTHGSTAGTDYLKRTSGIEITNRISPLVKSALLQAGAFKATAQLSSIGMNEDKLTTYVTQKTTDGIFTYMAREEARMRADPMTTGKTLLKGLQF